MYKEIISVCGGMSCTFEFSDDIKYEIENQLSKLKIEDIEVEYTGCNGLCEESPIVRIWNKNLLYKKVKLEDVKDIIEGNF